MRVHLTESPADFHRRAMRIYLQNEAVNAVAIGITEHLAFDPNPRWTNFYLGWIEKDDQTAGAFFVTPPYPLNLSGVAAEDAEEIAKEVKKFKDLPTSVYGPKEVVDTYATHWQALNPHLQIKERIDQGLYQLTDLTEPETYLGHLEKADSSRLEIMIAWEKEFALEAHGGEHPNPEEHVKRMTEDGNRFLWIDEAGNPVSVAGTTGKTPNGIRVGPVFTPKIFRKKGFASMLVAKITKLRLSEGNKFCFLNTDLSNPTSNSIYQKLGYQKVGEASMVTFG